ncbi:hypothetical protein FDW83_14510 [Pseudarthrobacter sp. NamE2]|uniref:PP_RS20740 family protein n=1 Tax=Pseudarthrobacter sp. NamE2 TaxID=2576838 RepID=UPI0010FEBB99|nr:hypothetical protein [Pseudarthrobacter sp. NamE2]TLM81940.1 hypothetical protein FDW83_14510 [Pseudarthrobacter sp. NamE2]
MDNMDQSLSSNHDDLAALIGDGPAPFPVSVERPFEAWHRPRKQYVRNMQWSREIGFLVRDLKLGEGELRYLTLPGNDFLDVRHLHESVCVRDQLRLKYLGFNTAVSGNDPAQSGFHSNEFAIKRLKYVSEESEVFPGDFRDIGNQKSLPWQRVRRERHFHAINIDLCGGFAREISNPGIPSYFTALQWLLQNQGSAQEDFLLFITTRMDADNVHDDARAGLNDIAESIYNTCAAYASEFDALWGIAESDSVAVAEAASSTEAFMLGLTQWIVSRGIASGLKPFVKSLMTYRTGNGAGDDDLVSIAVRFKPAPQLSLDPQGLVRPVHPPLSRAESECIQSAGIPRKVSERILVDELLAAQADAFERCIEESSALLAAVGYDPSAYKEWVLGGYN